MATLENLPDEVMIEILSRLPVESLLRFKSVRKSWYALINDPNFVEKHFSNSLHHNHVLLKSVVTKNNGEMENLFSILKFPFSVDRSESVTDVHFSCDEDFLCFEICGTSHGLICLSSDKVIFLSNPSTREIRKLPPSFLHSLGLEAAMEAVGFGYDAKSKDFKVVRIVYFVQGPEFWLLPRVEIYDLSKDRWREIGSTLCGHVFWTPSFEMYHEGTYYWLAKDEEGRAEMIQSFDMSEEIFGRISLPGRFICKNLGVLNGSIVLFNYPPVENEQTMDIWEMEKNECGGVSWSKLLTIDPDFGIEIPLLVVSSNELLMESKEGQLILYNIRSQKLKEFPIKGHPEYCRAIFVVKSLVSVKGGRSNISYGF